MERIKKEHLVKDERIRKGVVVDLHTVTYEGDTLHEAEVLRHPGAVAIAATHDDENFFLVDQFRFGVNEVLTEFPAGKMDAGESPEITAERELREEIGYHAKTIVPLGYIYTSPAFLDEIIYFYYATDLEYVGQDLDEDESLSVYQMPLEKLEKGIMDQSINDAKTLALVYRLKHYLTQSNKAIK